MYGSYRIVTTRIAKPVTIPKDYHMVVIDLKSCFLLLVCVLRTHPSLLSVFPLLTSESCTKGINGLCCTRAWQVVRLCASCVWGNVPSYMPFIVDGILVAASGECDLHAGLGALCGGLLRSGLVVVLQRVRNISFLVFGP